MDEVERSQKFEQQTEQIYAAIGRFAVKFEHVCNEMHSGIVFILMHNGLQNQILANAVLEGLTAEPLKRIFSATVVEAYKDRMLGDGRRILDDVLKRVSKLTEKRNDVIHRLWHIGAASSEDVDFSNAHGWKFRNTNKGTEFRPLHYTKTDFDGLSEEAQELASIIMRFSSCLIFQEPFTNWLILEAGGTVRAPRSEK